jgi:hypothetical protein
VSPKGTERRFEPLLVRIDNDQRSGLPSDRDRNVNALGYLISTISVFMLGVAAWPRAGDPPEQMWFVIGGMMASIVGMFLRYLSHRKQQAEIKEAKQQA